MIVVLVFGNRKLYLEIVRSKGSEAGPNQSLESMLAKLAGYNKFHHTKSLNGIVF